MDRICPAFDASTHRPTDEWVEKSRTDGSPYLEQQVEPISLEEIKTERRQAATDKRWEVETGGIALAGSLVRTDRESQALITGARILAMVDPDEPVEFKAASGWVTMDSATVIAIGTAVGRHVRACFRRERELHDAIDAAPNVAALRLIDIASGWPD